MITVIRCICVMQLSRTFYMGPSMGMSYYKDIESSVKG